MEYKAKIGIIGAGNVATHLSKHFHDRGHDIVGIVSRSNSSALVLAQKVNAPVLSSIQDMPVDVDLVLIATSDSAVCDICNQLPEIKGIVAHTSGSIPLSDISVNHSRAAVLYPLQTFSKDFEIDLSKVPFFIEATDDETLHIIEEFARELSPIVYHADSELRGKLHIAGVLSSNFPIYLLELTRRVIADAGLPLETVRPLVEMSIKKAFINGPLNALTGPAKRGDIAVIDKQSRFFVDPIDKEIYDSISKAILSHSERFKD